jgi:hypothetical protein
MTRHHPFPSNPFQEPPLNTLNAVLLFFPVYLEHETSARSSVRAPLYAGALVDHDPSIIPCSQKYLSIDPFLPSYDLFLGSVFQSESLGVNRDSPVVP